MALPKNILFPVDFSPRCNDAWPAVASMATQLGIPVTLMHAVDIGYPDAMGTFSAELPAICARLRERLEEFATPGVEVPQWRRDVLPGATADCIVERASKMEAPLIMMPTRGHTRFRQLLLGSVTSAVLHDAPCPVWTEAHTEALPMHAGVWKSIVCAVDMDDHAPTLLRVACEFSTRFSVPLHVVHSVPGIEPRFRSGPAERAHTFLLDEARERFPAHCRNAGIDLPLEIVQNPDMIKGIVEAVSAHGADLLIIGRGVIRGTLGRLRTNAHELIRRSPCPVLSV